MIDPVTAFAAAQAAFSMTKKLIGAGREIHDITSELGKWYEACSDLTKAESQRKSPKLLETMSQGSESIERQALDIIVRKKQLFEKEKEIKFLLDYRYGPGTYKQMSDLRKQIREERERTVYRAMEAKRQIVSNCAIGALSFGILGVLGGGIYLLMLALA